MPLTRRKLWIGALLIAGAFAYLGVAAARTGWVYLQDVAAFTGSHPEVGQRARVYGVVAERADVDGVHLRATFDLHGHDSAGPSVHVVYEGAVPEALRSGREVVVEGSVDEQGVFHADLLLTKCSSKYESRRSSTGTPERRE